MNSKRMLDKSSVGMRLGGAGAVQGDYRVDYHAFCSAISAESSGMPVCKNGPEPGSVLCTVVVGAGSVREGTGRKENGLSSRGEAYHGVKAGLGGLENQRDHTVPSGVLKRASPTRCLTTNGQPLDSLKPTDSRTPGKRAELDNGFQATQRRYVPPEGSTHPSSHIPVPRHRKPSGHADKEVMAATVLTSLSTSPMVLQPAPNNTAVVPDLVSNGWKDALSASYSSSTSGNWSWDASDQSVPSTPSPPLSNDTNKSFLHSSQGDDVSEDVTESTHFPFEDPIPRKRKNSMKVMFKCLWKNCDKVLSTSSGIQRHIRTLHLGRNGDSDYSDGEEDFYYSEIEVNVDSLSEGLSSLTPTSPTTAAPPPVFPQPLANVPRSEHISVRGPPSHAPTLLSQSAPSTLCHIRTDHAYQATAPVSIPACSQLTGLGCGNGNGTGIDAGAGISVSWQSPPVIFKGVPGPVAQIRTVSIGEKRQPASSTHTAVVKNHALTNPAPKPAPGTRKPRGEAKKCRKVYGMEKKDMWCTACRWKKACQRFTD